MMARLVVSWVLCCWMVVPMRSLLVMMLMKWMVCLLVSMSWGVMWAVCMGVFGVYASCHRMMMYLCADSRMGYLRLLLVRKVSPWMWCGSGLRMGVVVLVKQKCWLRGSMLSSWMVVYHGCCLLSRLCFLWNR